MLLDVAAAAAGDDAGSAAVISANKPFTVGKESLNLLFMSDGMQQQRRRRQQRLP